MSQASQAFSARLEKAELKSFAKADNVREFRRKAIEVVRIGGAMIGRAAFEPGWWWARFGASGG